MDNSREHIPKLIYEMTDMDRDIMELEYTDKETDSFTAELIAEREAILEMEAEVLVKPLEQEVPEAPERTLLKRDMERIALERLETSARTEDDFKAVIKHWDRLDANRERKERYHEVGRGDVPLEWEAAPDPIVIPHSNNKPIWKQICRKGDFIEAIFHCPFEMHELVEDADISNSLLNLKPEHKELFFYLVIKQFSTTQVASIRGQSDRNIRKVRLTIDKKIRKQLFAALQERIKKNVPLTKREQKFLEDYRCVFEKV